jgi:Spy/CpxP family protein refolding chaperone
MSKSRFALPSILLATGLLLFGTAMAGPPDHDPAWRGGPPSPEQHLARLSGELDLNEEQSREMLQLLQTAHAEHDALRTRMLEAFRPELCALRQDTQADILEILTPEQGELFLQLQDQNRSRDGNTRRRHGSAQDCDGFDG